MTTPSSQKSGINREVNKQNVPELRFPGFEDEWEEISIGDKFDFFSTNSFSRAKLDENGEILNIHYGDIHTKFPSIVNVKKENIPFVSDEVDVEKINKYEICKNGDLLIADASEDYADIGKTIELQGITDEKVIGGLHTLLLRDNTTNNAPLFNGYLFQNEKLKKQIKIKANGISVLGISKKELEKITIKIPSKEEQKNISDLLYSIDQKISSMEKKYEIYKKMKSTFLYYMFCNKQNIPELRFPGFKDEWMIDKLDNLFEFNVAGDMKKELFNDTKTSEYPYPLYGNAVENNGLMGFYKEFKYDENTITVTARGNIGVSNFRTSKFNAIGRLIILNKKIPLNMKFFMYVLNNLKIYVESTGVPQLTAPSLKISKVYYPIIDEQKKIAGFISLLDKKIELMEKKINFNHNFKKSLLNKMFC